MLSVAGKLTCFFQGKHVKTTSIITDEHVQSKFKRVLRSMKDEQRTPETFLNLLNSSLLAEIPNAPTSVSRRTVYRWMNYLGFKATKQVKGYYTDGHNR